MTKLEGVLAEIEVMRRASARCVEALEKMDGTESNLLQGYMGTSAVAELRKADRSLELAERKLKELNTANYHERRKNAARRAAHAT